MGFVVAVTLNPGVFGPGPRYGMLAWKPTLLDAGVNLVLFAPLGVVLARQRVRAGRALATLFVLSLLIELTQLASPVRTTAWSDLVFNAVGGAAGFKLANRLPAADSRAWAVVPLIWIVGMCAPKLADGGLCALPWLLYGALAYPRQSWWAFAGWLTLCLAPISTNNLLLGGGLAALAATAHAVYRPRWGRGTHAAVLIVGATAVAAAMIPPAPQLESVVWRGLFWILGMITLTTIVVIGAPSGHWGLPKISSR